MVNTSPSVLNLFNFIHFFAMWKSPVLGFMPAYLDLRWSVCGSAALKMLPVLEKDIKISCSIFSCLFFLSLLELLMTHSTYSSFSRIIRTKYQLSVSNCKYRKAEAAAVDVHHSASHRFVRFHTGWQNSQIKLAKLALPHFFGLKAEDGQRRFVEGGSFPA